MTQYVTFDGPDCTGKSTLSSFLADYLTKKGKKVFLTKEPGASDEVCQQIRKLLLNPILEPEPEAAFLLFMADRAQHIRSLVVPHLMEGYTVISDRSFLSGLVYHAAEHYSIDKEKIAVCNLAQKNIQADLAFILTSDVEQSEKILKEKVPDRIEQKSHAFKLELVERFRTIGPETWPGLTCWPKKMVKLEIDFSRPLTHNQSKILAEFKHV